MSFTFLFHPQVGQQLGQAQAVKGSQKTQLIAHEKPVHDIAFTRLDNGRDQFATAGLSPFKFPKFLIFRRRWQCSTFRYFSVKCSVVTQFPSDLRALQHSTILYEDSERRMLNHLAWNKRDPTKLATVAHDSKEVAFQFGVRVFELKRPIFGNEGNAHPFNKYIKKAKIRNSLKN